MSATRWMLNKVGHRDNQKFAAMVHDISEEYGVSEIRVKADMYANILLRGCGYTDYYLGGYCGATAAEKDTFVTTRSYYRLLSYLNDRDYVGVMRDKLLFDQVFERYLGRGFLNLHVATLAEFVRFLRGKTRVFAKQEGGFGGHGVECVEVPDVSDARRARALYDRLRGEGKFLVEEEIRQCAELNRVNPHSVASFRVVTLVKDGRSHVLGNALRLNQGAGRVIGCTGDMYMRLDEGGRVASKVVDDWGNVYERHPLTGAAFADLTVPGVRDAFELCLRAALEVPQVRYVGWDVAFGESGPQLMEGNAYPAYSLVQYVKMTGKRTGHLAEIAAVLGDEMSRIRL